MCVREAKLCMMIQIIRLVRSSFIISPAMHISINTPYPRWHVKFTHTSQKDNVTLSVSQHCLQLLEDRLSSQRTLSCMPIYRVCEWKTIFHNNLRSFSFRCSSLIYGRPVSVHLWPKNKSIRLSLSLWPNFASLMF